MTIVTCNKIDAGHLAEVKAQMLTLGAPTIRAIWDGEIYWAVEGSHRLVAAHELALEPIVEHIDYSDDVINVQWDDDDTDFVVSELADILFANRDNHILRF